MPFEIPETLNQFSLAGLEDLRHKAKTEYDALVASATVDTITDEELDRAEALQTLHRVDIPAELQARQDRQDRFSALGGEEEESAEEESAEEPEAESGAVTASMKVKVVDVVKSAGNTGTEVAIVSRPQYSSLVAAAGVPDYEAGAKLDSLLDVAKAFEARTAGFATFGRGVSAASNQAPQMYPIAKLVRDYPDELSMHMDDTDFAKLERVRDEKRLPGGSLMKSVKLAQDKAAAEGRDSLVAAQGWCAPSETDYDICLQITTDGMYDAPEVQARRGGVRHTTGIDFSTLFGDCSTHTGYFDLTEAQVAAGSPTKTCLEIPCPSFTDDRLGVTGLCLTGNILSIRGYPENTATFTRGALAALAHLINREQIADVVTGSTAVTLSGAPWATDGSTVSQVLSAVEMAIVDIKYRLRLQQSATLEVIMPYWILSQMRADWVRRNATGGGQEAITLADSVISAAFSARGARVQYVYDWQDAFATCSVSGSPGAATPIANLPTSLSFIVYPAGTWVRAVNDVITLNSVYDSTKLATNQVTHLFTETGWAMLKMCPVSRVYTVNVCPSGKTTNQGTLTCP